MTEPSGGGGAAPAPRIETNGQPAQHTLPEEIAGQLPDGFVLPPGFAFIEIPEVTPAEQVDGAVEHASMQYALLEAARRDLDLTREHAEGMIAAHQDGVDKLEQEWTAAVERARDIAARHGIDLPRQLPRTGAWTEPIPAPPGLEEPAASEDGGQV